MRIPKEFLNFNRLNLDNQNQIMLLCHKNNIILYFYVPMKNFIILIHSLYTFCELYVYYFIIYLFFHLSVVVNLCGESLLPKNKSYK